MEETGGNVNGAEVEAMREPVARVAAVPRHLLDEAWPIVHEWLEAALAYAVQHEMPIGEVWASLCSGEMLLLVMECEGAVVAAAVVQQGIRPQDGRPYIALVCCGGSQVERWLGELVAACKQLAVAAGAPQIIVLGRTGWAPLLKRHGLKQRLALMTLDLEGE
jgi:hypothetical protein